MPRPRITESVRRGLRAAAGYFQDCIDAYGPDFEALPADRGEAADLNAAFRYLELGEIDFARLMADTTTPSET